MISAPKLSQHGYIKHLAVDMAQDLPETEWHSIRPWSHIISLQVREVTSVSVTFVLRATVEAPRLQSLAAALGNESDEEEAISRISTISDALGRGLAVKVNGNHWQRVVVHVDEDGEEAIVIVYGLGPRKKYEINLVVVAAADGFSEEVTTQSGQDDATSQGPPNMGIANHPDPAVSPSTLTPPTTPIRSSPPRTAPPEERISQLRKQLSLLTAERDDLGSQLKLARRESQRTETALKAEIEALKRASEKHASGEHRSRQKVLALQEAVKQASAAASDIEKMVRAIEETLPTLDQRAKEVQATHDTLKEEVARKSGELDASLRENAKKVQELQGELSNVCSRLEKMTGKREKLETDIIPLLEAKLQDVRNGLEQLQTVSPNTYAFRVEEDIDDLWNVRNWVPPIQRPHPKPPSATLVSNPSTVPTLLRQSSLRSIHTPGFKPATSTTLPPILPSHDSNYSLRVASSTEASSHITINTHSPEASSESEPRSTFNIASYPQSHSVNHSNITSPPFDFVVRRPSPNPANGDHDRQSRLPCEKVDRPSREDKIGVNTDCGRM